MKKSEILLDFCMIPALLIVNFCVGGTLPAAIMLAVGIVLIVKGGDVFVDAATWIAEVSGIPKLIVGATVVSLATTLPELLVSAMAAHEGKVDMAIGNAIGSVTANIGLIMAIGMSLGGATGYAINPARDLAPRLAHSILPIRGKRSSGWSYSWVPVAGPVVGCLLAALCFIAIF